MGALVGALFLTFFNETKEKHHLNRGYDSESGTTIQRTQPMAGFLLFGGYAPGTSFSHLSGFLSSLI